MAKSINFIERGIEKNIQRLKEHNLMLEKKENGQDQKKSTKAYCLPSFIFIMPFTASSLPCVITFSMVSAAVQKNL